MFRFTVTTFMRSAVAALTLALGAPLAAQAQTSAGLLDRGAVVAHPAGGPTLANPSPKGAGFPAWYRDKKGVALDQCFTDAVSPDPGALGATLCAPLFPNPVAFPGNWGPELFYSSAAAQMTLAGGQPALLVLALEGSYTTVVPKVGDETVFSRIRVRARTLPDGMYRVTHPYGVEVLYAQNGKGVDWTRDIGFAPQMFDLSLNGDIAPFLQWVDPFGQPVTVTATNPTTGRTEEFLGDPNVLHLITGSPNNTNVFRMEQSYDGGATWRPIGEQSFFAVLGKKHQGVIPRPLEFVSATYSRSGGASNSGGIDVRIKAIASSPDTTVTPDVQMVVSGLNLPGSTMRYLGGMDWVAHLDLTGPPPGQVVVTNRADFNNTVTKTLADVVQVNEATYVSDTGLLAVRARTSDRMATGMLLDGQTPMVPTGVPGEFGLSIAVNAAPTSVRVVSQPGNGSASELVDVRPLNDVVDPPVAMDDVVITPEDTALSVNVAGNDTGLGSKAWTAIVSGPPANGTVTITGTQVRYTPKANFAGTDTFSYALTDGTFVSNTAAVVVTVSAVNDAPTAANDSYSFQAGTSLTLSVLNNDTDVDSTINPASVQIGTKSAALTLTVQTDGTILASATTAGTYTFTYTVADTQGARSAAATVTVTVTPGADTLTMTRAQYTRSTTSWTIQGRSTRAGVVVTAYNCATAATCLPIGSATVGTNLTFAIAARGNAPTGTAPKISFGSSGGGVLNNITVTVK